jgi:hypothetical protein
MPRLAPILGFVLAACVPVAQPSPPQQGGLECGAQGLQHLVGHPLPAGFTPSGVHRIYRSGDMLTLDYNPERLNIELAPEGGTVVAVQCG